MIEDFVGVIKARWRIELAIFFAVMLAIVAYLFVAPRSYQASASLLFDTQTPQPVASRAAASTDADDQMIGTQADIIRSQAIAAVVSQRQNLAVAPEVVASWRASTGGLKDINYWVGSQLLQKLVVVPVKGSRVLTIQYASPSPDFAAQIANAFATAYMSERLRLQTDPAKTYARWFEDRTKDVRFNLERAQAALATFKKQSGIVDNPQQDTDATRYADLSGQLVGAESQAADANSRASNGGADSPDVQNSSVVAGLRAQIAAKSAQVSQMSATLGPNHPDMIAARAELSTLQSKLSQEVGTSTHALSVASGAANARTAAIRAKLNAQRGEMLSEVGNRSKLQVLQRDVDSAQAAYDAVAQQLTTMRLQSEVPSTNVTQLDQASAPLLPSSPNVLLLSLLGIILGTMLAVGVALALEFFRPRVRTLRSLREIGGVPVVARVRFAGAQAALAATAG